ncbi:MAG: type 1 glutamine amidotransferase [Pseudomonadota bacterium]
MRLHYLQYVPFENPGYILEWAKDKNTAVSHTLFFENNYNLPDQNDFDALVVMGGPIGVYDHEKYSWLEEEQDFIKNTIALDKPVLGICLGAQLIASALGAKVYKGTKEIGWFPVQKKNSGDFFNNFPDQQTVFHWHGDTFDLPENATLMASNDVTQNQVFEYKNVVGLQFHFEMAEENVEDILHNAANDLTDDEFVQSQEEIISQKRYFSQNKKLLFEVLDNLFA